MFPTKRKPQKMGVREPSQVRSASHLAWVRKFTCSIFGRHECSGRVEAHHIHEGADGGIGIKPGDDNAIPLCSAAHRELHDKGETWFSGRYAIDLTAVASRMWRTSPHRQKVEASSG